MGVGVLASMEGVGVNVAVMTVGKVDFGFIGVNIDPMERGDSLNAVLTDEICEHGGLHEAIVVV